MAGSSKTRGSSDKFSESLQRLQELHDEEVSALVADNVQLREQLERLRNGAGCVLVEAGAWNGALPFTSPGAAYPQQEELPSAAAPETPLGDSAPEDSTPCRNQRRLGTGSRRLAEGTFSEEVTQTITRHLDRKRSATLKVVRLRSGVGSELLDEFSTYRQRTMTQNPSGCVSKLVSSPKFDMLASAIIVLNSVTIGLEASFARAGRDVPLAVQAAEYVFLSLYSVEVCLRLVAVGKRGLCNAWVLLDIVLVCSGILDSITNVLGHSAPFLDNVMLARTFRLARLARVLRLMIKFHTLWMLIHGLMNSLLTLTWTCIIVCMLLFVFAVLGLELLQPDPLASEEYNRVASENFGSLYAAAVSLLQGMTLDSFAVIYRPVLLAKPLTVFYFVPFLLVVSISLMNLVTALMVNFSLEQAVKDKQAEELVQHQAKAEVVGILERAFSELDSSRSGRINLEEMLEAPEELRALICQVADVSTSQQNLTNIFRTLDFDGSGYIEVDEFCEGLLMLHDHTALQSFFIMRRCSTVLTKLRFRQKSGENEAHFLVSNGSPHADSGDYHMKPCAELVDSRAAAADHHLKLHADSVDYHLKPHEDAGDNHVKPCADPGCCLRPLADSADNYLKPHFDSLDHQIQSRIDWAENHMKL